MLVHAVDVRIVVGDLDEGVAHDQGDVVFEHGFVGVLGGLVEERGVLAAGGVGQVEVLVIFLLGEGGEDLVVLVV